MIGLELSVRCEPPHRVELLQTIQDLCLQAVWTGAGTECRVFEDLGAPNRFLWLQWWRSQSQLDTHLRSEPFRALLGAIRVLGSLDMARIVELQDSTSILGAFVSGSPSPVNPPSAGPGR